MLLDGQLLIGSTALNVGGTHCNMGFITSTGGSVTVTNGSGTINLEAAGSVATTYITNSGSTSPIANQLTIIGSGILSTAVGPAGTITISSTGPSVDLHVARYIVSAGGTTDGANYTTIASAYAAAVAAGAPQTVFVQPGTYTENLTLTAGINLTAFECDDSVNGTGNVKIVGKLTMTTADSVSISGIELKTNSDFFLAVTGSADSIVNLNNCYLNCINNTGISFTSSSGSSAINIYNCNGNLGTTGITYYVSTSNGAMQFSNCILGNTGNSVVPSTNSANAVRFSDTTFRCLLSSSGTGGITGNNSYFNMTVAGNGASQVGKGITMTSTATFVLNNCTVGGTSTYESIDIGSNITAYLYDCSLVSAHATDAITGAASLYYGNLTFPGTATKINISGVQTPLVTSNDAIKVTTPGAYPYTTIPQDAMILVDTASARTIVPLASPITGQKHIIKDSVGSAAANNITITPSGKNIDGAASYVMSSNWGSITIVYGGSQWHVV